MAIPFLSILPDFRFSFNYFQFVLRIVAFDINLDKWRLSLILKANESVSPTTSSSSEMKLSKDIFPDITDTKKTIEKYEQKKSIHIVGSIIYDKSQKFLYPLVSEIKVEDNKER